MLYIKGISKKRESDGVFYTLDFDDIMEYFKENKLFDYHKEEEEEEECMFQVHI